MKSDTEIYNGLLKVAFFVGIAAEIWDAFSGDNKAGRILPILFGIVVFGGILVIVEQLEEIKRRLSSEDRSESAKRDRAMLHELDGK